ncbi:MAG: hypothetical protein WBM44_31635 [Waterburya sp.]
MTAFNFLASQTIGLFKSNTISALFLTSAMLLVNLESSMADTNLSSVIANTTSKVVKGQSGGSVDSQGCGFVSSSPSYEMNLGQKVDYMRFTVQADGGQPTLLVLGPNSGDSFCVLGDKISGLKPEISGVWEAGYYQIYVGDRTGSQHEFILDISTDN